MYAIDGSEEGACLKHCNGSQKRGPRTLCTAPPGAAQPGPSSTFSQADTVHNISRVIQCIIYLGAMFQIRIRFRIHRTHMFLGLPPGSGSTSQRHGSTDQDPHQNVMDPEHFFSFIILFKPALLSKVF